MGSVLRSQPAWAVSFPLGERPGVSQGALTRRKGGPQAKMLDKPIMTPPVSANKKKTSASSDLTYDQDDPEHRIGIALTGLRRFAPSWFEHTYGPSPAIEAGQHDALWTLVTLFPEGCRMTELAAALRIDRSTATRAVDRLVSRGLAERSAVQDDKRVLRAKATKEGVQLFREMSEPASKRWRAILHTVFTDDELAKFAECLERLLQAQEESREG
jgi:DNA-binding MarR family transcriptional regulator